MLQKLCGPHGIVAVLVFLLFCLSLCVIDDDVDFIWSKVWN